MGLNKKTRKTKVGVSGILGFVGIHLANTLIRQGYEVIGFDNHSHPSDISLDKQVKVFWGDVRNQSDCAELVYQVDVVIHLAAEISVDKSIEDPQRVIDVNINGTKNMLEMCRHFDTPIIIASSSEVYGTAQLNIDSRPLLDGQSHLENYLQDEKTELLGQSPYAATKISAERLGYAYYKTYGLDVRIVRSFNICGEGQGFDSYGGVIAIFANKLKNNQELLVYGDGKSTRDYTYVSDAVSGYITILEKGKAGEVYNIATGNDWEINYIAEELKKMSGKDIEIVHIEERKGEVYKLKGDASKLRELGWKPKVSFNEALKRIWKQKI